MLVSDMLLLLFGLQVVCNFFAMPWTIAHQCSLSMGFLRQEYWGELPFPAPGDFSDPGIEPITLALAGRFFTTREAQFQVYSIVIRG